MSYFEDKKYHLDSFDTMGDYNGIQEIIENDRVFYIIDTGDSILKIQAAEKEELTY